MGREAGQANPSRKRAGVYLAATALALSLLAIVMIIGNVAAGAPPEPDENTWAHLFQLAMAAQPLLLLLFVATADWTQKTKVCILLAAQVIAVAAAFGALAWSGY